MRTWIGRCGRALFGAALLFGTTGAGCLTDVLREASEELDDWADDLGGEDDNDLSDFVEDLEALFD